jgi:hypothetical protein
MYKDKKVFIQEDKNNAQTDKPDREFKQSGQPLAILKNNSKIIEFSSFFLILCLPINTICLLLLGILSTFLT